MTAGDVTVPFVPGADAVALTITVFAGNKVPIKKPWPVQVAVLVLFIPITGLLLESVKVHVAVELISVNDGAAVACRQNGIPPLADTDCDDGVTVIEVTPVKDTVRLAEPVATPWVAVTVAVPAPAPVTRPDADTVAMV